MYLKRAIIENSGPLKWLDLKLQFTDANQPKPLILVGSNGGGNPRRRHAAKASRSETRIGIPAATTRLGCRIPLQRHGR